MIKYLKRKYIKYKGWSYLAKYMIYYQIYDNITYILPENVLYKCSLIRLNDIRCTFLLSDAESYCIMSLLKDKYSSDVYESLCKNVGEALADSK